MRTETNTLNFGPSHASLTLVATLDDTDQVATGVTLASVASDALVEAAVNKVHIENLGGGNYEWTASVADAFDGYIRFTSGSLVLRSRTEPDEESEPPVDDATWFYANQGDVEDLIGEEALRQLSLTPSTSADTVTDAAKVQRAGLLSDALMDGELSRLGYTTPLANMSDGTVLIMANISAGFVLRELNKPRMILTPSQKPLSEMDRRLYAAIGDAESNWRRLKLGLLQITADRAFSRNKFAKVSLASEDTPTFCGSVVW